MDAEGLDKPRKHWMVPRMVKLNWKFLCNIKRDAIRELRSDPKRLN